MAKRTIKMPWATSIVARSWPDHVIGIENTLPWHLGTDLRHFRRRTEGHAVIMGRKTYESIGRPLPKRKNIVLSTKQIASDESITWAQDVETALFLADVYSICNFKKHFFVIGGENIFSLFREYINKVYLTEVFGRFNGDAKFDWDFPRTKWRYYKEKEFSRSDVDDYAFRITTLVRLKPRHREETVDRLLRAQPEVSEYIDRYSEIMASSEVHTADEEQLQLL